jgi:hypothetical protein
VRLFVDANSGCLSIFNQVFVDGNSGSLSMIKQSLLEIFLNRTGDKDSIDDKNEMGKEYSHQ